MAPSSPLDPAYTLELCASGEPLARRAAELMATTIDLALAQRDRCQIALAGGSTPEASYVHLGQEHLAWDRVDVVLGDERWVEAEDPSSNARMLRQTLLAQPPGRSACLHPVPTDRDTPEEGARAYSQLLRLLCPGEPPLLDLALLGLGDDGHTASLFPGTEATRVRDALVTVGEGKGLPRVTLTAPILSAARRVLFLVSGAGKAEALRRLLDPSESPERTPARLVRPSTPILVLADNAAASLLQP
ncbi:6-phosphogluconolactonase [Cyanobium sp. NIES-981]|uniref:6-phosphogluconolactonase n=1 Tax=Cyanobium sp. NIES-981 TaxID=1851505 RepID=UPI000B350F8E|nr:6-phosphogluconolactonase [Cyanobium sp. NIES-981]